MELYVYDHLWTIITLAILTDLTFTLAGIVAIRVHALYGLSRGIKYFLGVFWVITYASTLTLAVLMTYKVSSKHAAFPPASASLIRRSQRLL